MRELFRKKWPRRLFILWFVFFILQLIICQSIEQAARIVAGHLTLALVAHLVVFCVFIIRRRPWERKKVKPFVISFVICCLSCLGVRTIIAKKQAYWASNFNEAVVRIKNNGDDSAQYPYREYGDFSKVLPIIKEHIGFVQRMMADIAAATDYTDILNPTYLCEYANVLAARNRLSTFLALIIEWEQKYGAHIAQVEATCRKTLSRHVVFDRQFLDAFQRTKEEDNKLLGEFFQIEKTVIQKLDTVILFLFNKKDIFWEVDGQLVFHKDEDAEKYNQLIVALNHYAAQEKLILQTFPSQDQVDRV